MLDSLSYDIKITLKSHFCRKNVIILSLYTQHCYGHHNVSPKTCKPLVVYRFYCMALFNSQRRRIMINHYMGLDPRKNGVCGLQPGETQSSLLSYKD